MKLILSLTLLLLTSAAACVADDDPAPDAAEGNCLATRLGCVRDAAPQLSDAPAAPAPLPAECETLCAETGWHEEPSGRWVCSDLSAVCTPHCDDACGEDVQWGAAGSDGIGWCDTPFIVVVCHGE